VNLHVLCQLSIVFVGLLHLDTSVPNLLSARPVTRLRFPANSLDPQLIKAGRKIQRRLGYAALPDMEFLSVGSSDHYFLLIVKLTFGVSFLRATSQAS